MKTLVLQDFQANEETSKWGKLYASDQYAYDDINFRTTVELTPDEIANEREKVIIVERNNSDQTVKIETEQQTIQVNALRKQTISKNKITLSKDNPRATITVANSYPTAMFSGQVDFRVRMLRNDWLNIFDSSVLPSAKIVHGRQDTVIFVSEDD